MRSFLHTVGLVLAVLLVIDAAGFFLWALSGQVPTDDIYVGTITTHALRAVVK